ncbi:MAG: PAS domain-containing protein [Acidobacteria bacterium]|nr:PAS domain-containing protein [Acidobacteriota bacterium]
MPQRSRKSHPVTRARPVKDAPGLQGAAAPRVGSRLGGNRFFRDLVGSMRNGVLAITRDGHVALMNNAAYRILNLKPRPTDLGRPCADVLAGQREVARILSSAFELSNLPSRAELRLKTSGKVIGYTLSLIADGGGRPIGAALFFKDLTRVEQLEERERLRDRLAALGEMAAAIAHEVKNPLASIEVMAGVLRRQLSVSGDARAILNDIIKEAKLANAIVLEVLDFVRPIRLQVERVDMPHLLRDAVATAEGQRERGATHVTINPAPDLPPIDGDPHQLRQIFVNLIINAFEALNGQGHVRVEAFTSHEDHSVTPDLAQPAEVLVVDVADDGPGMPEELTDRIFSPFFTTKAQGSGLGLAIVRKIVDAHDGRIDIVTRQGSGTRFRITLPVSGAKEWFR